MASAVEESAREAKMTRAKRTLEEIEAKMTDNSSEVLSTRGVPLHGFAREGMLKRQKMAIEQEIAAMHS